MDLFFRDAERRFRPDSQTRGRPNPSILATVVDRQRIELDAAASERPRGSSVTSSSFATQPAFGVEALEANFSVDKVTTATGELVSPGPQFRICPGVCICIGLETPCSLQRRFLDLFAVKVTHYESLCSMITTVRIWVDDDLLNVIGRYWSLLALCVP